MNSTELKPCPFCGAAGEYRNVQDWHGVGCETRNCPGQRSALHHRTKEAAFAAWNRRASINSVVCEAGGWRPIETAPKDGTHVLLALADGYVGVGYYDDEDAFPARWLMLGSGEKFPTRWMPLPQPPGEVAEQPTPKRYALSPDNGLMYESERGPWVRYADLNSVPPPPGSARDSADKGGASDDFGGLLQEIDAAGMSAEGWEAKSEPSLSEINELAKTYASSYASPHHITFTVEGLRNLIAASPKAGESRTQVEQRQEGGE